MRTIVLICLFVADTAAFPLLQTKVKYDNYTVYRFVPQNENEVQLISSLEDQYPGQISFWKRGGKPGMPVDIMVPPPIQLKILSGLQTTSLSVQKVLIENVQALIDEETIANSEVLAKFPSLTWLGYYSYEDIMDFLDEQVEKHPKVASLQVYGSSFEGRRLKVIKISKGGNEKRPIIFLDANIHAREWITNAVATYVINELLNGKSKGVKRLLNTFDFHIAPMLNPDGYEFSRNFDRMWRKTRSNFAGLFCRGADPNRNFGYKWNSGGSSDNCFTDTYMGSKAFSEPETKYMSEYFTSIQNRTVAYVSLHCYSQLILIPYGTKNKKGKSHIPDHKNHMRVAKLIKSAIARRYGTKFKPGNVVDLLYVASGGSVDWAKGVHNTTFAVTFELRDTGKYGFFLPPEQIIPSSLEFIDGLIALAEDLKTQLAAK